MNKSTSRHSSRKVISRLTVAVGCGLLVARPLAAVVVGAGETKEIVVGSGTQTQQDRITVAEGGVIYKNGNGTLIAPDSVFVQSNPVKIGLKRGPMTLKMDGSQMSSPAAPPILQEALFWVDASLKDTKPELFVAPEGGEANAVEKWYDVRETTPATPHYLWGWANHVQKYTETFPCLETVDGRSGLYFFGAGSGVNMDWMQPNGSPYNAIATTTEHTIQHAFVVVGVKNSWGFLLGGTSTAFFHVGGYMNAADSLAAPYWLATSPSGLRNGTTWIDGEQIDGLAEKPRKGYYVFEVSTGKHAGSADNFFRDRNIFSAANGKRSGGDYICEAIVFTNELTAAQRADVNSYLAAKWFPERVTGCVKQVFMGGDANAKLTIDASASGTVLLAGTGDVVKTGIAAVRIGIVPGQKWTGELTVSGGSIEFLGDYPISVKPGMRLTSIVDSATGLSVVTCEEGVVEENVVEKTGNGQVTVASSVPTTVTELRVTDGNLALTGPRSPAVTPQSASTELEIQFTNPGFEEWDDADANLGFRKLTSALYHGWGSVGGDTYVIDYANWTLTSKGVENASRNTFKLLTLPPGNDSLTSRCALFLRTKNAHPYCPLSVTRGGWYELSFDMCGRESEANSSYLMRVQFMNASGALALGDFGRVLYTGWSGSFRRQRLFANITAGSGNLHFVGENTHDCGIVLDNFRLRFISATRPEGVLVPGGDFESTLLTGAAARTFSTENTMAGWTFAQDPSAGGATTVGLSTHGMPFSDQGRYYNDSRGEGHGYAMVHFVSNGTVSTTFTPAAGTWQVQASVASKDRNASGILRLQATAGGVSTDLGAVSTSSKLMHDERWPVAMTCDGTTPVALTFSYTQDYLQNYPGGFFLDDVRLMPVDEPGAFAISPKTDITLGADATLTLDYTGTNAVNFVRRGRKNVGGDISAAIYDWVFGKGALLANRIGFYLMIR